MHCDTQSYKIVGRIVSGPGFGFIPNSVGRGGRAPIFEQVGAIPADLIVLDILLAAADNGANSA